MIDLGYLGQFSSSHRPLLMIESVQKLESSPSSSLSHILVILTSVLPGSTL